MKRILIAIMLIAGLSMTAAAQEGAPEVKTKGKMKIADTVYKTKVLVYESQFAVRDTCTLSMDIYKPDDNRTGRPCVVFVYGGGFVTNNQRVESVISFCNDMAAEGFVTVATDYRLGLKGLDNSGTKMISNMDNALKMSTEDLFSAVEYLIAHADELGIDPAQIILIGSSAGAITVLQADYELGNGGPLAAAMPEGFRFAGVVSLAGAIFSHDGKCKWRVQPPAPTLFLHGTSDKLVTYDQIKFFKLGFFGTKQLVKRFEKFGYPYMCIRFTDRFHEVAAFQNLCFEEINWFIKKYVFEKRNWKIDATITDPDFDLAEPWNFSTKDVYGKDSELLKDK
ncbi:MAG: alpha/beta hydrolase [Bacteroidales bacterium]|nr:alpha/beta hydrolase [Bacteroidales bacterium]